MLRALTFSAMLGTLVVVAGRAASQQTIPTSPADGHNIHVTAPHVVAGKVMGP